ncbi:MAG: hypothetical protein KKA84_10940 [Bacteroidetes bacterium]|nr:hypothetical protein [Bacteroidota bacterium]
MKSGISSKYWDNVAEFLDKDSYYYNLFTGDYKAKIVIDYLSNYLGDLANKSLLKTDLYEEAKGSDQLLFREIFILSKTLVLISPILWFNLPY